MSVVSIGDFLADDSSRVRYTTSIDGWYDGAPVTDGISDKAQQDGGWDGTGYRRPRVITVNGFVEATSRASALSVSDEVNAIDPHSILLLSVSDTGLGTRQAWVRVTAAPTLAWLSPVAFRYSVQLKAPDPLKYGPATFAQTPLAATGGGTGLTYPLAYPLDYGVPAGVTPGSISVPNDGSASYWPRLRIDGPVPNPVVSLQETGDWVRFNGTVAAGQWLDFDLANRRVLVNGLVSVRAQVSSSGAWLAVPPGGGSISWTADAADPAASLSVWGYQGAWA